MPRKPPPARVSVISDMHGTAVQARSCYIEAGKELAGIIRVHQKTLKSLIEGARRKESFTFDVAFAVYCQSRGDAETMTVFFHQNRQVSRHVRSQLGRMHWREDTWTPV